MEKMWQSLTVKGTKKSKRVNALIDSGEQTKISEKLANEIEPELLDQTKIVDKSGKEVEAPVGAVAIKILRKEVPVQAVIVRGDTNDLTLGGDFIEESGVVADYEKGKLRFQ